MTDEELIQFCDAELRAQADLFYRSPVEQWQETRWRAAMAETFRAARESVALRRQVATLREALEPFADYSDTAADALDATKGTDR